MPVARDLRGKISAGDAVVSHRQSTSRHHRQRESRVVGADTRAVERVRLRDNRRRIGRSCAGEPIVRGRKSHRAPARGRRRRGAVVRRALTVQPVAGHAVRLAVQNGAVVQLLPGDAQSSMQLAPRQGILMYIL